ncbi:hypothetical protein LTR56_005452 [Elasticomyces elasticus]|nr:hypothetical protein LTR22_015270 [Elasticomyces elasticus]KAK3651942.1 hypothetical protein LTR56_005452 [Elasticomyces elasticus]KAK4927837.1 hypothetical protein LTR49_005464 [Elasticomyces elasticus]
MLQIFHEWELKLEDRDEPHQPYHFSSVVDEVFRLFLVWLYTDSIPPSPLHRSPHDVSARLASGAAFRGRMVRGKTVDGDTKYYEDLDLVRLHQFGAVHGAPEASNAALSYLAARHEHLKCTTAVCAIKEVQAMQPRNSLLNLCLVEEAARWLTFRNIPRNLEQYPGAFVQKTGAGGSVMVTLPTRPDVANFAKRTASFLASGDLENIVTIAVGIPPLVFSVHESLICRRSTFFGRAFRGGFAESGTKTLQLPDEAVGVVATFLDWLYTGRLNEPSELAQKAYRGYVDDLDLRASISEPEDNTLARLAKLLETHMVMRRTTDADDTELCSTNMLDFDWDGKSDAHEDANGKRAPTPLDHTRPMAVSSRLGAMVDLYLFAERTGVRELRNDIIDLLAQWRISDGMFLSSCSSLVRRCFAILPASSKLLDWMVHEAAYCWSKLDFSIADTCDAYPPGFVDAAIQELLRHSRNTDASSWRDKLCEFHEHLDDVEQQACRTKHEKWYVEVDDEAERMREPQKEFGIPHGRGWRIQASPLFIRYLEGMAEDTA